MFKRLVGTTYLLLGLAAAFALVSAYRWRTPRDAHIEKTGAVALGYEVGDQADAVEPFTFAVVRGARGSHATLAHAFEIASANAASPVVVLGQAVPAENLARWRLARVIADHTEGVVHLSDTTYLTAEPDPLLATTLATPEAFAFRAHGCTFRGGSEAGDWESDTGLAAAPGTPTFAFTTTSVRPPDGAAAAVFQGAPTDEVNASVELVSVAADGSLTRSTVAVPTMLRPADAWRAFECSFLPIANSVYALVGLLVAAVALVALGLRILLHGSRTKRVPAVVSAPRRPTLRERLRATPVQQVTAQDVRAALRG